MKVKFWGVRGSIPTPGIDFVKYGGNTSCVEIEINDNIIIFDMGSGIVKLGNYIIEKNIKDFDILMSHFHYDHTCGLPFFLPAYNKQFNFSIRSGKVTNRKKTVDVLKKQISSPSFPIGIDKFLAKIKYYDFDIEKEFLIKEKIKVKTLPLNHPDGATGYRIEHNGKSVCYITDHEHNIEKKNEKLINFVKDANVLIYDSTYDDSVFKDFLGWGHSTWQEAVRLANECKIENLFIFHHNPENCDKVLDEIQKKCSMINKKYLVAREGMLIKL